jgi:hydrogenase expression/formation protein HypE
MGRPSLCTGIRGNETMSTATFDVGKLPMELLQVLLERYGGWDERLVVGPHVGEDAAVLDMGERYLVVKSDPITFATDEIGWYVVHVNANDIATMGGTPRWLLLTLLLPENRTDRAMVERIFSQCTQACRELGIALCGGHTEITYGLDRPIAVGLMLGEVDKECLVLSAGAQVGDSIILTKGIAIEGTALLAKEMGDRLKEQVSPESVVRGKRFLLEPGISVLRDARIVRGAGHPHAMHDPTEGGLATGLWELAHASGNGIVLDLSQVHIFPETQAFCQALSMDPLGVIASGALLVSTSPEESLPMVEALMSAGIHASVIGHVVEGPPTVRVRTAGGLFPLPTFTRDEVARVFEEPA